MGLAAIAIGALIGLVAPADVVAGFVGAAFVIAIIWRIRLVEGASERPTRTGPGLLSLAALAAGLAVLIRVFGLVGGIAAAVILLIILLAAGGEIF